MVLRVQVISDLHLEFRASYTGILKVSGDVLCMAGDICVCGIRDDFNKFVTLLQYVCKRYKYVIHVAGNHEYYTNCGMPMADITAQLKALETKFPNYKYLSGTHVVISIDKREYAFIGATLWTEVPKGYQVFIRSMMNDYNYIYMAPHKKVTMQHIQSLHAAHKRFLIKAMDAFEKKRIPYVVITHHKPLVDLKESQREVLSYGYETDLQSIFNDRRYLCAAIHGHTHKHYNKKIGHTHFVANPKGYPREHTLYEDDFVVTI